MLLIFKYSTCQFTIELLLDRTLWESGRGWHLLSKNLYMSIICVLIFPTDCRDWEADQGAVPADSHHNQDCEQAWRRDHHLHHEQLRDQQFRQQDRVARQGHFCYQLAPQDQPHLRLFWRHQGDGLHLHLAQECAQEVCHDFGFEDTDLWIPLRCLTTGQSTGKEHKKATVRSWLEKQML